jgi:hypothetical protein
MEVDLSDPEPGGGAMGPLPTEGAWSMDTGPPAADKRSDYITTKAGITALLKKPDELVPILASAVRMVSSITQRGSLLLKLYLLHCIERNVQPALSEALVLDALKAVCEQPSVGKEPAHRGVLLTVYEEHLAPLLPEGDKQPSYLRLGNVLGYSAKELITAFENNVKANFVKYVDAFVAASCRKKEEMERIQNDATLSKEDRAREKRDLLRMLRTIKEDLLNVDGADFKSKDHVCL